MIRFVVAAALLAAPLLATPLAAQMRIANPASDQLASYGDTQRRAVMRGIVRDGGVYCKQVDRAGFQGRWGNMMMWRARCGTDPRLDYAVFIGPDSTAQVRACTDMKVLKLPACRPFPPRPEPKVSRPARP